MRKPWELPFVRMSLASLTVIATIVAGGNLLGQSGPEQGAGQGSVKAEALPPAGGAGGGRTDIPFDPPVATRVQIKWLEKEQREGNALVQVEFDARSRRRLGRTLVIQPEDSKVTLSDDGQGGDEKANDGLFSAVTRIDFKEMELGLRRGAEAAKRQEPVPIFEGRVKVSARRPRPVDFAQFKPGGVIEIPRLPIIPGPPPPPIDPARSLMITDLSVVNDPSRTGDPCSGSGTPLGKWSFGYLMTQIANQPVTGINPSDFVRFWLSSWETAQTVNGFGVPARTQIASQVIGPWEAASGGPGAPLDLAKAPFRLLAIVNRIDLRDNFLYGGGPRSAGEARLVFCAVNTTPGPNCGQPLQLTVIFEYGIKKANCTQLKAWGKQWADLSTLALGTPAYNNALEVITESFVTAGADPSKPNGSALNQIRTNEIALAFPWELREFNVSPSLGGLLDLVTVKQTPDDGKNGQAVLADYVNANLVAIKKDKHVVPALFPFPKRFLGSRALTNPPRDFWDGPAGPPKAITDREARHHFSLNTCNGCHGGETFPDSAPFFFTHIAPREATKAAALSGFLTGNSVPDPADGMPTRPFADLDRRRMRLQELLSTPCFPFIFELFFEPLRMVH